jgi:signal transduction histidine kinase
MTSIRRRLLGFLLLLMALGLSAVGVLVDRFADASIRSREESESERIKQAFEVRRLEAKAKFDADLLAETKPLAQELANHTRTIIGQDPRRFGGGGGGPKGPDRPEPKMPDPPAVLKGTEADAREFRLRSALLEFAPGPFRWPALAPVAAAEPMMRGNDSRNHRPYPNWADFIGPRMLARVQDALRKALAEDEHPPTGPFQVALVGHFSGRGRVVAVVGSDRVPGELTLDSTFLDPAADQEPKFDDVTVPGLGLCRRVSTGVLRGGRPNWFFVFLPSPPAPAANARYRDYPPFRGPDFVLRLVVQTVRPYYELDARLKADQTDRDEQLGRVRDETRLELSHLRARLVVIGSGTFAALVLGGWVIVARGLSPLRKLSDAVSKVSEKDFNLPVEAAELGRELAPIHARLTQTLTLLQRAFAREKQAVADISHELRTPIASLLATIDVALRKPRTPEQYQETLRECRLISKQLGQLVERIMTLALLDAGSDQAQAERTDARELAAGCCAVIRPLAAAHNIEVAAHLPDELFMHTDAAKLREVLMNLLHNAVEYNRPGGAIDLSLRAAGGAAVFEVRDTGIGMTPEVRERIFERFYRADASRHATGVHAGLGLAIVKEYVARLGGTIEVESEPDRGTTFRVTLPLGAAARAESPGARGVIAASS